jgi:RNA polymerase sigma-70 factor, ECF subfamily
VREDKPKFNRNREQLYQEATSTYAPALNRLVAAYESDPDKRRDLMQEIHLSLWRSFEVFEGKCSMRTWVYRIAHNTAASYVIHQGRMSSAKLVTLEELDEAPDRVDAVHATEQQLVFKRLLEMIHRLRPVDRQIMLLYLEEMDAPSIGEIVGISAGSVRTQIHRIKTILGRRFRAR